LCKNKERLSSILLERIKKYPSSGEINSPIEDPKLAIVRVFDFYKKDTPLVDTTDGISLEFSSWRFNLRLSNTEPIVRLNVESRGDSTLVETKVREILTILRA
jgi:phosphomannomutase